MKPHIDQHYKISTDPHFAEKVRDVTGLHLNPPDAALVLCAERENPDPQPWTAPKAILPILPGMPQRRTHDYNRYGTKDLFAALDIASGKVITQMTKRHRAKEFIAFSGLIDKETPKDLHVHIVLDNVSTHNTEEVQLWRVDHEERFTFHSRPDVQFPDEPGRTLVPEN